MKNLRTIVWGLAIALALIGFIISIFTDDKSGATSADVSNSALVTEGKFVYLEHCAVCHGKNLEGQPNWRTALPTGGLPAPPHDASGHTWHHTDQLLFDYTKLGGQKLVPPDFKSNMPGFEESLSDHQIWAVLAYIKSTWPANVRKRQEQLNKTTQTSR